MQLGEILRLFTAEELKDIARTNDISGYSNFKKDDLVEYLVENLSLSKKQILEKLDLLTPTQKHLILLIAKTGQEEELSSTIEKEFLKTYTRSSFAKAIDEMSSKALLFLLWDDEKEEDVLEIPEEFNAAFREFAQDQTPDIEENEDNQEEPENEQISGIADILNKVSKDDLMWFCQDYELKKSGTKDEIIERILSSNIDIYRIMDIPSKPILKWACEVLNCQNSGTKEDLIKRIFQKLNVEQVIPKIYEGISLRMLHDLFGDRQEYSPKWIIFGKIRRDLFEYDGQAIRFYERGFTRDKIKLYLDLKVKQGAFELISKLPRYVKGSEEGELKRVTIQEDDLVDFHISNKDVKANWIMSSKVGNAFWINGQQIRISSEIRNKVIHYLDHKVEEGVEEIINCLPRKSRGPQKNQLKRITLQAEDLEQLSYPSILDTIGLAESVKEGGDTPNVNIAINNGENNTEGVRQERDILGLIQSILANKDLNPPQKLRALFEGKILQLKTNDLATLLDFKEDALWEHLEEWKNKYGVVEENESINFAQASIENLIMALNEEFYENQADLRIKHRLPEYQELLRKYTYTQLKEMQSNFMSISSDKLEHSIEEKLNESFADLVKYFELQQVELNDHDQKLLFRLLLKESEPIRAELMHLIKDYENEQIRIKKLEEEKKNLERKKQLSAKLFGVEIVTPADIKKIEQFKPLTEEIDELFKSFASWERISDGKKVD